MGSAQRRGKSWDTAATIWQDSHEPPRKPLYDAILDALDVGVGTRLLDSMPAAARASVASTPRSK